MITILQLKEWFLKKKWFFIIPLMIIVWLCLFVIIKYKFTFFFTSLTSFLWFCTLKFTIKVQKQHDNSWLKVDTFYYRGWLLNITLFISVFYGFYIYLCLLARGIL